MNVRILVGCSGSMSGGSIEQARLALSGLTKLLTKRDRFSLTLFGSEYEQIVPPVTADRMGLIQLNIAVRNIGADYGGTEMRSGAEAAFDLAFPALADPTDQTCWDADRLDLGRVGIKPAARYLSLEAGTHTESAYLWSRQRRVPSDFEIVFGSVTSPKQVFGKCNVEGEGFPHFSRL